MEAKYVIIIVIIVLMGIIGIIFSVAQTIKDGKDKNLTEVEVSILGIIKFKLKIRSS